MSEFLLDCLRDEAALGRERGERLSTLEVELIESAPGLSEDERAALWLFAWSYRPRSSRASERLARALAQ